MNIKKENTIRALKDQPLLAPMRCKFGFHRWQKWQQFGNIQKDKMNYSVMEMKRICDLCGLQNFAYTNSRYRKVGK